MRKKIVLMVATALMLSSVSVASAASFTDKSTDFEKAWVKKIETSGFEGKYGYNTWATDEDYIHAKNGSFSVSVYLSNGNGEHYDNNNLGGATAKIDVPHAGSSVTYKASTVGFNKSIEKIN